MGGGREGAEAMVEVNIERPENALRFFGGVSVLGEQGMEGGNRQERGVIIAWWLRIVWMQVGEEDWREWWSI